MRFSAIFVVLFVQCVHAQLGMYILNALSDWTRKDGFTAKSDNKGIDTVNNMERVGLTGDMLKELAIKAKESKKMHGEDRRLTSQTISELKDLVEESRTKGVNQQEQLKRIQASMDRQDIPNPNYMRHHSDGDVAPPGILQPRPRTPVGVNPPSPPPIRSISPPGAGPPGDRNNPRPPGLANVVSSHGQQATPPGLRPFHPRNIDARPSVEQEGAENTHSRPPQESRKRFSFPLGRREGNHETKPQMPQGSGRQPPIGRVLQNRGPQTQPQPVRGGPHRTQDQRRPQNPQQQRHPKQTMPKQIMDVSSQGSRPGGAPSRSAGEQHVQQGPAGRAQSFDSKSQKPQQVNHHSQHPSQVASLNSQVQDVRIKANTNRPRPNQHVQDNSQESEGENVQPNQAGSVGSERKQQMDAQHRLPFLSPTNVGPQEVAEPQTSLVSQSEPEIDGSNSNSVPNIASPEPASERERGNTVPDIPAEHLSALPETEPEVDTQNAALEFNNRPVAQPRPQEQPSSPAEKNRSPQQTADPDQHTPVLTHQAPIMEKQRVPPLSLG